MAAVAGSKGRLTVGESRNPGPQLALLQRLLDGSIDSQAAATALLEAARLREVGVDTNMICNLACQYCYLSDRREAQGEPSVERLGGWLESMVLGGAKLIAFIGKEPLADDRAISLLKHLNQIRKSGPMFRTGMVTNGTLLERRLPSLVEAEPSYLDISIDGLSDVENALRGPGVAAKALAGIAAAANTPLRDRLATATVLTHVSAPTYAEFVRQMVGQGVPTCFSSPVLRFAMSNAVDAEALSLSDICRLIDVLSTLQIPSDSQIIIDLPYRYTWALLREGTVKVQAIKEDAHEALYWPITGTAVNLKFNPFPYSFWRALRVTHDGSVILDMDLAAHPNYRDARVDFDAVDRSIFARSRSVGAQVLAETIESLACRPLATLHERDLARQHARLLRIAA